MNSSADILGSQFYDSDPLEPNQLYQGEILTGVPILAMPKPSRWQLLRTRSGKRVEEALQHGNLGGLVHVLDSNQSAEQWGGDNLGDYAMGILDKRSVLVLSQNCDVQYNHFLQIAPIYSAEAEKKDVDKLRDGEIFSAFWVAKNPPEISDESFADLELIQSVHKSYIKRIRPNQHFRLSPGRIRMLQRAITRYFGRPNSFDSRSDVVPRTGTYLCVSCFYMDGQVSSVSLQEEAMFPTCQTCGGTAWVIKGR